jgi:beta-N-acetylhexosaminidase
VKNSTLPRGACCRASTIVAIVLSLALVQAGLATAANGLALAQQGSSPGIGAAESAPTERSVEPAVVDPVGRIGVPLDEEAREWVERTLASLTLRQRVAQMVMPWVPGQRTSPGSAEFQRMLRWVGQDEVGGLIISRGPPDALVSRLNAAQARSRVPLLISADLESGPAMRISPGGTNFPPAMAFAAADDLLLAREAGRITGIEARSVGIHLTLGPLLDVNSNPLNPIINVRAFGEDPARVGLLATSWAAGAREAGLLSAGKHFPGHGATSLDSHVGLPTLHLDSARLESVELLPFRFAIEHGIDAILVGHIAVAAIDGDGAPPATLSSRLIDDLLRARLGFEGLVVTDALNMGAITRNYTVGEASIRAVLAGADILLQPPGHGQVIDAIVDAVRTGRIPAERIDAATRRVLAAKAAAGLHRGVPGSRVEPALSRASVGAPSHRDLADRLTQASITLVRDEHDILPLERRSGRILHLAYTGAGSTTVGSSLTQELRAAGFTVEHVRVADRLSPTEERSIRQHAVAADLIIASAFVTPRENRPLAVGERFARIVEELSRGGRPVVAVSLGSPYILDAFPSVPAYLLAWSASESAQRAAGRAILGTAPITGRLPVSLGVRHPLGTRLERNRIAR